VKNRPDDITVHAAVCNSQQSVHYVEREAASGVWEFASETFRDYWWKEVAPDFERYDSDCLSAVAGYLGRAQ
jgi:hypothetical protein